MPKLPPPAPKSSATPHYRHVLQHAFRQRKEKNHRYSLRSFARWLGISPALLSKVLNGKAVLSLPIAERISATLFELENQRNAFLDLVKHCEEGADSSSLAYRKLIVSRLTGVDDSPIEGSLEKSLANWLVFAVFELFSLQGAPSTIQAISRQLGTTEREAELALAHLCRLGLVEQKGSAFHRTKRRFHTTNNIPSASIRDLHRQFIGKAISAIDAQSVEKRYFRAVTVGLNSAYLSELRQLIDGFLFEISKREAASENKADCLYQINVQMFNLLNEDEDEDQIKETA